ncbi:hypothetical protein CLPUN_39210 [Clostridium puniceum]|uniref:Uncharacterized protein n=1 Tax=Clostridium puniceum TaxID=29367 RepID=A0A1S8T9Q6_9CLOT|nr:DUF6731 family protein [Clostridium puniceum]OOM74468.1 hypothetical protein CLPUN_39210 [Clostridium puniceum]
MNKKKNIKFDYGRIYIYELESIGSKVKKNRQPLKLEKILIIALEKVIKERTRPYYGEDVILQKIEKADGGVWKLQFIRQRSAEVPGIIDKKSDEFKKLELDDSEYIGEDIAVLYHEKTNVLMVQRNKNAIGMNGIRAFVEQILNSSTKSVEIKLVPFTNNLGELKKIIIRKVEVSFAETNDACENSSLAGVIIGARKMKSMSTKVVFSVGHSKKDNSLTQEEVMEFTKLKEEDGFKKVHVEYRTSKDEPIEQVEFINGTLVDQAKFEYSKENEINYERIIDRMIDLFKQRKPYLEKIFI